MARLPVRRPERASDTWFFEHAVSIELLGDLMLGRPNRDDAILEASGAHRELERFAVADGRLVVEITTPAQGRDPAALHTLAERTGVHIVLAAQPTNRTDVLVDELQHGVDGIRAGVISLSDGSAPEVAWEAAAATGAPVLADIGGDLDRARSLIHTADTCGIDPARIAVRAAHDLLAGPDGVKPVLDTGAHIVFDRLGRIPSIYTTISDHEIAATIADLVSTGHGDRILLGAGLDRKHAFTTFGGNGLRFLPLQFLPYLTRLGVPEDNARRLVTTNPARFLAWTEPIA
ncbi:hypothetical protein [Phytoactinopolyspora limicola]|uniref:phosphotriesterase family protein n=1 Tax=Phytoactinopolyspora limicola TaxID=2715536 RepID=UPI00140887B2|nr:hypothetical protein [Phytoactinopolyspora limicola]